jgi:hypothetical protein
MKQKLFFSVLLIAASAFTAKAQFYAGGTFSILSSFPSININGISITANVGGGFLDISPEVGYNLNEKWAIGGKLSVPVIGGGCVPSFSPYGRYTFYRNNAISLFADGGVDFVWSDPQMHYGAGITPGIMFKTNDRFSFFGKCGYIGYSETPLNTTKGISLSSNNLKIGFYYNF